MFVRKITVLVLLLFSAHFSLFSQEILKGTALSAKVEDELTKNGFEPLKQELSSTGQDEFAWNLILNFPAELKPESENDTLSERKLVIFCFMQEDFQSHKEELLDFLLYIKGLKRTWEAQVLFSALDTSEFESPLTVHGTEIFASSQDDFDNALAITASFSSQYRAKIHTGGRTHTTPLWLARKTTDAFFGAHKNYSFEGNLSALFRLGIINGKERLSYFFKNEIPAIEIDFSEGKELSVLKNFAENYTSEGTDRWDTHYIYINRGNIFKPTFINEQTIIITCLSLGILTILILCVFSFIGPNGEKQKYEFIRSSYMLPFTIALSFLSLLVGQAAAGFLSRHFLLNPIILYGIKIVFSMIFISTLFTVQGVLRISITAFIYGYILSVVSIFNIFLFSTRDITLFVIFAAEYLIIYFHTHSKKLPSSIFFFLMMTVPFFPYGVIIIKNASEAELLGNVFSTPLGNLILSLAILPFQISWLRLLVFTNVFAQARGYKKRRIIFNGVISTAVILAFTFSIIFSISHFIYKPKERAAQRIETNFVRQELFTLSAKITQNEFSGMNTSHIMISSEKQAVKYEVMLTGEEAGHPIYDSIYDYEAGTDSNGFDTYFFIIPDYPPQNITIDCASPLNAKARISVTAYYATEDAHTFRFEKRELKVE